MIEFEQWIPMAVDAWNAGEANEIEKAFELYAKAEAEMDPRMKFSPALNVLRHGVGDDAFFEQASGMVMAVPPTEDMIYGIQTTDGTHQSITAKGMSKTTIDQDQLEANIRKYHGSMGFHLTNLRRLQPHLMIMSTGRCGTVSLYRLLQQTQYIPHHNFVYNPNHVYRLEQMCRFIEGNYQKNAVVDFWLKTRAAEWLGAMIHESPVAFCSHHDTIFAPIFSLIHFHSRVVYLRRNPRSVFASMYGKKQWGDRQLRPIFYAFDENGNWAWKDQDLDTPEQIVWYLKFTEAFSRALGNVISDRWIEIDADKLFEQDPEEIEKLYEFLQLGESIGFSEVQDHFGTVYNRKAHKDVAYDKGLELFEEIWDGQI
jgi:hypothetical protein